MCWFFGEDGSRTDGAEEVYGSEVFGDGRAGFFEGLRFFEIYIGCFWVGLLWYSILGEVVSFGVGGDVGGGGVFVMMQETVWKNGVDQSSVWCMMRNVRF